MASLNSALLDSYLGKHIDEICPAKYVAENHCAHFVGHVLDLRIGYQCTATPGVSVKVQKIFEACPSGAELHNCQGSYPTGLLFVTQEGNVNLQSMTMANVPKKHIGIVCGGKVWHYSNTRHRVVSELVEQFLDHYPNQRNGLWLCPLPVGAVAHSLGQ
jgi:hypothetical protein